MDQAVRLENSVNDHGSCNSSGKWNFFGNKMPKSEIVFFVQVILVYIVVIVSIVNLTIGTGSDRLWIALLSSSIGYILPNPSIKYNKP